MNNAGIDTNDRIREEIAFLSNELMHLHKTYEEKQARTHPRTTLEPRRKTRRNMD